MKVRLQLYYNFHTGDAVLLLSQLAVIDATDKAAGNQSIKLVSAAGAANQELVFDWKGYTPNISYTAAFRAKTRAPSRANTFEIAAFP